MDVDRYVTESAAFTRITLISAWQRWLLLAILGIPWAALVTLLMSRQIFTGTVFHGDLIPWNETGALITIGVVCNLALSGYLVRLLRGESQPPPFSPLPSLFFDGIRALTIPLVWMIVPVILTAVEYQLLAAGFSGSPAGIALLLAIAVVQVLIVLYAVQYAVIGTVRFARTGYVREAFNLPAIKGTFSRIGWVNYYVGLGVILVVFLLVTCVLGLLTPIPLIGPLISVLAGPLLSVYCARFIAHFCDEDLQPAAMNRSPLSPATMAWEFLFWLALLGVLAALCLTPLVVVTDTPGLFFP